MTAFNAGFGSPAPASITRRRLLLALAVSLALHFAIASRVRMPLPPVPLQPLEATLVAAKEERAPPPPPTERQLAGRAEAAGTPAQDNQAGTNGRARAGSTRRRGRFRSAAADRWRTR